MRQEREGVREGGFSGVCHNSYHGIYNVILPASAEAIHSLTFDDAPPKNTHLRLDESDTRGTLSPIARTWTTCSLLSTY